MPFSYGNDVVEPFGISCRRSNGTRRNGYDNFFIRLPEKKRKKMNEITVIKEKKKKNLPSSFYSIVSAIKRR